MNKAQENLPNFQVNIISNENPKPLRALKSEHIGKLININGIIVNAGKLLLKGKKVRLVCGTCGHTKQLIVEAGMCGFSKPFFCEKSGIPIAQGDGDKKQCPRDPYYIATDSSEYVDFQI